MGIINEENIWHDVIYALDTSTPVKGGQPVFDTSGNPLDGFANAGVKQLADRTRNLKDRIDNLPTTGISYRKTFVSGVDFIPGATQIDLAEEPTSKDSLLVFFDAAMQQSTEYDLSGSVVTFTEPIPMAVEQVEIVYGVSVVLGKNILLSFDSVESMVDFSTPTEVIVATLSGYYAPGDGGGGDFLFDPTSTEDADGGTVFAPSAGSGRWKRIFSSLLYSKWFGAKGDGTSDDSEPLQNAINAAVGKSLIIGDGWHELTSSNGLHVPSESQIFMGQNTTIYQPKKGKMTAFYAMPGSKNISISGGNLLGPYHLGFPKWVGRQNTLLDNGDTWAQHLADNIGIEFRGRMYQREILQYTYEQMLALTDEMTNISLSGVHIYGFGQSAVIADNITGFYADKLHLHDCGRDGLRMYGVVNGFITRPFVHDLLLGKDGAYPNWNVYGITCTRVYGKTGYPDPNMVIGRTTKYVSVENFNIYNCYNWKSLDTHGGTNLRFINGVVKNSYIGIGIDSGGSGDSGLAPPKDINISGVQFISDDGAKYKRAAITVFASGSDVDGEAGYGDGVTVTGCIFDGYGGDNTDGVISISNFKSVNVTNSVFKNFTRAAVFMTTVCRDINIGSGVTIENPRNYMTISIVNGGSGYTSAPDVTLTGGDGTRAEAVAYVSAGAIVNIDLIYLSNDWTVPPTVTITGGGGSGATATANIFPGRGVLVGTSTCSGTITGTTMRNDATDMVNPIGVEVAVAPAAGYGFKVSADNNFFGSFSERVRNFRWEGGGTYQRIPMAVGRCNAAGNFVSGYGITSITKTGTGTYVIELANSPAVSANQLNPIVSAYDVAGIVARPTNNSGSQITVRTTNTSATLTDAPFTIAVWLAM